MTENTRVPYELQNVSAQEISGSIVVRRTATVSEAGLPDPLTAYWEDPFAIPFVPLAIELIRRIDNSPETPVLEQVIVDLSQAAKVNETHAANEAVHPKGSNEARIVGLLLDRAREKLSTQLNPPGISTTKAILPPEIGVNRTLFRPGSTGKP